MFGRKEKGQVLDILLICVILISSLSSFPLNALSQTSADAGLLVEFDQPTGNEIWSGSTEHNISWTLNTTLKPSEVNLTLEYVYNGTGPYLIKEYGPGELSNLTWNYTWMVPRLDCEDVKIMIRAEGGGYKAWNMVSIGIDSTSPRFISTSPEEGEILLSNSSVEVTFSEKVDQTDFSENFSLYRGDELIEGFTSGRSAGSNYTMEFIPDQNLDPSEDYYFELKGTIKDASDPGNPLDVNITINFTVEKGPPRVQVTTAIEDVIRVGNSTLINWSIDQAELAADPIDIYYSVDGGDSWIAIASGIKNKGSIEWEVPEESLVQYPVNQTVINVSCENEFGYKGYGHSSFFTIFRNKKPHIELNRPYAGLYLVKGQKTEIRWNASDEIPLPNNPISISISTDGGISWRAIAHNLKNDGSYIWEIDTSDEDAILNISVTDKDGGMSWVHSPELRIIKENPLNLSLDPTKDSYHPQENINVSWEKPIMAEGYQFMRINLTTDGDSWRTMKEVGAGNTSAVISAPFAMSSNSKIRIEVIDDTGTLYYMDSQEFEIFPVLKDASVVRYGELTMVSIEFETYVSRWLLERSLTLYKDGEKMDISADDIYARSGSDIVYLTKDLPKGKYRLELNSSQVNRDFKSRTIFTFEEKRSGTDSDDFLDYWPILLFIPILVFLLYHYRKRLKPTEKTPIDKVDIEKHQKYKSGPP